jgi:hypothetical protein
VIPPPHLTIHPRPPKTTPNSLSGKNSTSKHIDKQSLTHGICLAFLDQTYSMKKLIVSLSVEENISVSGLLFSFLMGVLVALLAFCIFL